MENLSKVTVAELPHIIKGIILGYEYTDSIDYRYVLEFFIEEFENSFKVKYDWVKGVVPGTNGNPETAKDDDPIIERSYFKILKSESLKKLCDYVMDAISEVTAHEFDAEMEEI